MKTRCYIAGAGEYCGRVAPRGHDYIIAADAGYSALMERGIKPDLVVGDFDSLGSEPGHPNVIRSPAEKDDTDMMLAVKQGLARGYKEFIIDGGLGGRLDHTFANIQVLVYLAKNGAQGYLFGREICVTAITDKTESFPPGASGTVSIFAAGDKAEGVTLAGMKYKLENATLTNNHPLGISNEFTGEPATATVCAGTLIIMWSAGELAVNS